jgi:hypothetical protein
MPRTIVGPNRMPSVNWMKSEREEIKHRVANFKAHQQRLRRFDPCLGGTCERSASRG